MQALLIPDLTAPRRRSLADARLREGLNADVRPPDDRRWSSGLAHITGCPATLVIEAERDARLLPATGVGEAVNPFRGHRYAKAPSAGRPACSAGDIRDPGSGQADYLSTTVAWLSCTGRRSDYSSGQLEAWERRTWAGQPRCCGAYVSQLSRGSSGQGEASTGRSRSIRSPTVRRVRQRRRHGVWSEAIASARELPLGSVRDTDRIGQREMLSP